MFHSPHAHDVWQRTGLRPTGMDSGQISHPGDQNPASWAILCCPPGYTLAGVWSQEPEVGIKAGCSGVSCRCLNQDLNCTSASLAGAHFMHLLPNVYVSQEKRNYSVSFNRGIFGSMMCPEQRFVDGVDRAIKG